MPSADFCCTIREDYSFLSPGSRTCSRSPTISSTAFNARPTDSPPALLMDVDFAVACQLVRRRRPYHPVLVHRPASLLHASFRPRLTATPLRFAITSPPSGFEEDLNLQAVEHARRTKQSAGSQRSGRVKRCGFSDNRLGITGPRRRKSAKALRRLFRNSAPSRSRVGNSCLCHTACPGISNRSTSSAGTDRRAAV